MNDTRPVSPCIDQTQEDIETYYRNAEIGQIAVVRHTQHHILLYRVLEIESRDPPCIYVRNAGAFYMKSGKNRHHPTGQTSLVVPTHEVLAWANEHPRGELGYSVYRPVGFFGR
ncbi:hypothetical protein EN817_25175 [Mesorhizobium sp. M3A.F.Ca.ET.174.01.1.1]|uniref:hypothetical protein n=1 Tax=unclassified Mesorhizobium TaxID=325217 RepID=UPI001093B54E|nr:MULTISPECIES: hypothetical protein [unclassified Mesorhizobium]TGS82736.1 hypothetical protein EN818_25225 [Mesorhizobium sp. M3A.F.Ca.ET.175.01.1.1]TGT22691.1 hypothetical protein EN817_25175 [Mesorhizobium sp. M3A.F.Ca.ET.174.01.1.1]